MAAKDYISEELMSEYDGLIKDYIDDKIGDIDTFDQVVAAATEQGLPDVAEPKYKTLYFVPNGGSGSNIYNEFIWAKSAQSGGQPHWEKIGSLDYVPDIAIQDGPVSGKLLVTLHPNNPQTKAQYLVSRESYSPPSAPTLPAGNTSETPYVGNKTLTILNPVPSGTTLRYTINGADPTATSGSESTNGKITLPQVNTGDEMQAELVLKVVAVKNGLASTPVVSETYYVNRQLAQPTFASNDPQGTKYDSSRNVTITNNAVGGVRGTLKYKIGNGEWVTPTLTNNAITIAATGDVSVKVEKENWESNTNSITVTLNAKKCYIGRGGATLSSLSGLTGIEADNLNGERTVTLASNGYIWFVVPDSATISSITSGPLSVPFSLVENSVSGYNCYRTDLEINAGTYTYNIA